MSQRPYMFHEPISDMLASLAAGRLRHDGNPVLTWAAFNAILVQDRQQQVMFDKRQSKDKIDPIVAAAMAYRVAMIQPARSSGPIDILPKRQTVDAAQAVKIYAAGIFDD